MNNKLFASLDSSFVCHHNSEAIASVQSISTPYLPRENTFVFIKNKKFLNKLLEQNSINNLGIIFCETYYAKLELEQLEKLKSLNYWFASVAHFDKALCTFSKFFHDKKRSEYNLLLDGRITGTAIISPYSDIAQNVFIGENVKIEKNVKILPGCVIHANSIIGEGTIIYSNVVIYPDSIIGNFCSIHSNSTIGADGFGYNFIDGEHTKVWHFAGVKIGNNVDIGSNSCVDQGAFTPTTIGDGTKIDNFCQIAHNCMIGKNCIFCGRSGCSGSVTVEDFVIFGAGAGAGPGSYIEKGAKLAAVSIVSENTIVPAGEVVAGHPAVPLKQWLRSQAKVRRL